MLIYVECEIKRIVMELFKTPIKEYCIIEIANDTVLTTLFTSIDIHIVIYASQ